MGRGGTVLCRCVCKCVCVCVCVCVCYGERGNSVRVGEKGVKETDRQADRWTDTHTIQYIFGTSATSV